MTMRIVPEGSLTKPGDGAARRVSDAANGSFQQQLAQAERMLEPVVRAISMRGPGAAAVTAQVGIPAAHVVAQAIESTGEAMPTNAVRQPTAIPAGIGQRAIAGSGTVARPQMQSAIAMHVFQPSAEGGSIDDVTRAAALPREAAGVPWRSRARRGDLAVRIDDGVTQPTVVVAHVMREGDEGDVSLRERIAGELARHGLDTYALMINGRRDERGRP
ncbi:hypothetical protein P3W85_28310 [Cupriavidus basilensis]|uniref:Uncharacterized protein n=1 Tax=Cupriavidus basilensis TaxID=68895 RepID=A0ABT6AW19_9BURK|nr:hypothetical protein [Cupriavidus basilensis]MDF3836824.1 hypothetical protein [Cupriavidus basilensis]